MIRTHQLHTNGYTCDMCIIFSIFPSLSRDTSTYMFSVTHMRKFCSDDRAEAGDFLNNIMNNLRT